MVHLRVENHFQNPISRNVNLGTFFSEPDDSTHIKLGTLLLSPFLHNLAIGNHFNFLEKKLFTKHKKGIVIKFLL